jgi:hypothetical protein
MTPASDEDSNLLQIYSSSHGIGVQQSDSPRKRAVLTDQQAADIFKLRLAFGAFDSSRQHLFTSRSAQVSKLYGVSPKAVRDIWNMRTWRHATKQLWTDQDILRDAGKYSAAKIEIQRAPSADENAVSKCVGRPRGAKDSKPRKLRVPSVPISTTTPISTLVPPRCPMAGVPSDPSDSLGKASQILEKIFDGDWDGLDPEESESNEDLPNSFQSACEAETLVLGEEEGHPSMFGSADDTDLVTDTEIAHMNQGSSRRDAAAVCRNRFFPFFLPMPTELDQEC